MTLGGKNYSMDGIELDERKKSPRGIKREVTSFQSWFSQKISITLIIPIQLANCDLDKE